MYAVAVVVSGTMLTYRALFLQEHGAFAAAAAASATPPGSPGMHHTEARLPATAPAAATASLFSNTLLVVSIYWPRQLAASLGWFANDFAFYGNKVESTIHPSLPPFIAPLVGLFWWAIGPTSALC